MDKRTRNLLIGIAVGLILQFAPLPNITPIAQTTLALTMMTIVFWATNVAQSGFTGGIYIMALIITGVAEPSLVFKPWSGSTMWLVMGAYLIAGAVKNSGLGERIAYAFIIKFVTGYRSIIISIFALTFILSLLIPHPWPRAFLIMAVMAIVIKGANMPKEDAIKVGFTVFAASVPVSLIFLTGDAVINPLAAAYAGVDLGWLGWFKVMGPPSIVASVLTCILILILFKPTQEVSINIDEIKEKQAALGKMQGVELRTAIWVAIAIVLWATDAVHGVNIGWVTLIIPMLMSLPKIGDILTVKDWSGIPVHVLVFLTAAMAIGIVGGATGMNSWIADVVLPSTIPSNPFVLGTFITFIAIVIHIFMGSVIAVMGVAIPALILFTEPMGIPAIIPTMIVYTVVAGHYILPFHHLNMLVGQGEENGMYSQKETTRLGIPLIAVMFIVAVFVEVPYWLSLGLFNQ